MNKPAVSVIVPTYNRAYCLRAALQSLQRQTYPDWEALVVDDGSSDGTGELVARLSGQDSRIRYFAQANAGVSAARNLGLARARGAWLGFLDSDDAWRPWKLEAQMACVDARPELGLVCTDMDAIDSSGRVISPRHLRKMYGAYRWFGRTAIFPAHEPFATIAPQLAMRHEPLREAILHWGDAFTGMIVGNLVHTSTVLLSRERLQAIGGFDERLKAGEDYEFHLRAARAGPIALLDACAILYRLPGGRDQLTAKPYAVHIARNALLTRQTALVRDRARVSLSAAELAGIMSATHAWLAEELFDAGAAAAARRHFLLGAAHVVRHPRVLAKAALSLTPAAVRSGVLHWYHGRHGAGARH